MASRSDRTDLHAALTTPPPAQFRRLRNDQLYVPWSYMAGVMNDIWPGSWSAEIVGEPMRQPLPPLPGGHRRGCRPNCQEEHPPQPREEVVVRVRVTNALGFVQEAYGGAVYYPGNPQVEYADVLAAARSIALRRAIATWGPGLDVVAGEDMDLVSEAIEARLQSMETGNAWREALARHNLTEKAAIILLSKHLAGDASLGTLEDLVAATGMEREEAHQWLAQTLDTLATADAQARR